MDITSEQQGTSNLEEMTIFAFGETILLRGVNARALMNDPLSDEVITQDRVKEISCPISAEDLGIRGELCSDHSLEGFKNCGSLILFFHENTQDKQV